MKKIAIIIFGLIIFVIFSSLLINTYIKTSTKKQIVKMDKVDNDVEAVIVLGASIKSDGSLSLMLQDRLTMGIEIYKNKVAPKIIMSGDHGSDDYDEVTAMKNYALQREVKANDIFLDHAGFSTYDSIYRAKNIFKLKKVVIVSQRYHLYRALHIANKLGLEAYGIEANGNNYNGQFNRDFREYLARNKDFFKSLIKPSSTYMGELIDISGDGTVTH